MKLCHPKDCRAFTLLEGLVVVGVVLIFMMLSLIHDNNSPADRSGPVVCRHNLMEAGFGFRIWAEDHNDKYPMEVSVTEGGARELMETGNVAGCYLTLSNNVPDGFFNPEMLVCPLDSVHKVATNFEGFGPANLSYFIGLKASPTNSPTVLSGDDNLAINGQLVSSGIVSLGLNITRWTTNRQQGDGNILLPDGSVRTVKEMGGGSSVGGYMATNRIVIP